MKFLNLKYILNLKNKEPLPLGRWNFTYDDKILEKKIKNANEDHCGCCDDAEVKKKVILNKKHCRIKNL